MKRGQRTSDHLEEPSDSNAMTTKSQRLKKYGKGSWVKTKDDKKKEHVIGDKSSSDDEEKESITTNGTSVRALKTYHEAMIQESATKKLEQ